MTWGPLPPSKLDVPTRRETFIDITVSGSATVGGVIRGGDIISTNWDGAIPLDLSSEDTDATVGYALDGSEGASQWMGDVFVGGDLLMIGGGAFKTATSGIRIEIDQADQEKIKFPSAEAWEEAPAYIRSATAGEGDTLVLRLGIVSAYAGEGATGGVGLTLHSESQDDTNEEPGVILSYFGDSAQAPELSLQNNFSIRLIDGDIWIEDGIIDVPEIQGLPWQAWSPSYSNLTIGNGAVTARYVRIGDTVFAFFRLIFGSTTSMNGSDPTVSKPVAAYAGYNSNMAFGWARMVDAGTGDSIGSVRQIIGTNFNVQVDKVDGTYSRAQAISPTVPFTWTTGDHLTFFAIYEAA